MTKYVSIIGNGESRRGFDISPLKDFSTVVGCNALYRDYMLEYVVCCDRHMCQEAANTVSKKTTIFTRDRWVRQFQFWSNIKKLPNFAIALSESITNPVNYSLKWQKKPQ